MGLIENVLKIFNLPMRIDSFTGNFLSNSTGQRYFVRVCMAGCLVLVALTGCSSSAHWDTELACSGEEQSSTIFSGDVGAHSVDKKYTNTIDFHLRGKNAMVKSFVANIDSNTKDGMTFSAKNQVAWISGKFDKAEGRTLVVEGKTQQIRTTGQYLCRSTGAAV